MVCWSFFPSEITINKFRTQITSKCRGQEPQAHKPQITLPPRHPTASGNPLLSHSATKHSFSWTPQKACQQHLSRCCATALLSPHTPVAPSLPSHSPRDRSGAGLSTALVPSSPGTPARGQPHLTLPPVNWEPGGDFQLEAGHQLRTCPTPLTRVKQAHTASRALPLPWPHAQGSRSGGSSSLATHQTILAALSQVLIMSNLRTQVLEQKELLSN